MRVHTVIIDEKHRLESDKNRNDIGAPPLVSLFETGAKRGIHLVLADQILSRTEPGILGNLGCCIITQLPNPKCIWFARQSMGLSEMQARRIIQLKKGQVIVKCSGHPTAFLVKVQQLSFPSKLDVKALEKIAQEFLDEVTFNESEVETGTPSSPKSITSDALKVFMRVSEAAETIAERCKELNMERGRELRSRELLEAKGFIAEEEVSLGRCRKIYKVTTKGKDWAKKMGIKVKHYKSGTFHEYLLNQVQKRIGSLNTQFKFQRNSDIAREHNIQPDLLLIQPLGIRTIIEICCTNLSYEAQILTREQTVEGVDMVIAVTPNQKVMKELQSALEQCQPEKDGNGRCAPLVVLDGGECFSKKFDWVSVFEKP